MRYIGGPVIITLGVSIIISADCMESLVLVAVVLSLFLAFFSVSCFFVCLWMPMIKGMSLRYKIYDAFTVFVLEEYSMALTLVFESGKVCERVMFDCCCV